MTDFQIRSDNVDVEQIMRQIRARIREKRGVDYTEDEINELARVKLEKFLDPTGVRSDLLAQFRKTRGELRNYAFEDSTLFESRYAILRFTRKMLRPILKLFFSPNPLIHALHIQAELNGHNARRDELQYEVIHNLVLETTRLGIQVKNLKMQVESMSSRLDFDERRARALEGVVQYRPGIAAPLQPPQGGPRDPREEARAQERRTRRRRRRGRRPGSPREGGGAGFGEGGSGTEREESGDADTSGSASFEAAGSGSAPQPHRDHSAPVPPQPYSGDSGLVSSKPHSGDSALVAPKPQSGEGG